MFRLFFYLIINKNLTQITFLSGQQRIAFNLERNFQLELKQKRPDKPAFFLLLNLNYFVTTSLVTRLIPAFPVPLTM
jgi:hypothetical protein